MKKFKYFILILFIILIVLVVVYYKDTIIEVINDVLAEVVEPETPPVEDDKEDNKDPETVVSGELTIHFLELGNKNAGDCTYIKAGDVDILIDGGSMKSSSTTIEKYIDKYCTDGILEYVIVTHAHEDHIAAFVDSSSSVGIFSYYEVKTIIDYALQNTTSKISQDYIAARDKEVLAGAVRYSAADCVKGQNGAQKVYQITEDITLEILDQKYYYEKASTENDYSVCAMVSHGEEHFLFTGDLELEGEESLVELNTLPKVKVFKGGHHGSKTSSNDCLLSVIQPEIICICTCAGSDEYTRVTDNMFVTQEAIDRMAKYTDKIYVTSLAIYEIAVATSNSKGVKKGEEYLSCTGFTSMNGNIVVTSNKDGVTVNCSNNNIVLKDSEWFNTEITLNGVTRKMRTWPANGK